MIRQREAWFEFKGVCSDRMGIMLAKMPIRGHTANTGTYHAIGGRPDNLWVADGGLEMVEIKQDCDLIDGAQWRSVAAWLTGGGLLRFPDESDLAWDARVVKTFTRNNPRPRFTLQRFTVTWACQPLRQLYPEAGAITFATSGQQLQTRGTAPARPRVEIRGSGDFQLTIGRDSMFFEGIQDGVVVDSQLMDALTLDGAGLLNNHVGGDFYEIDPAYPTYVSWILDEGASVSSVRITPRWRFY